jgi:hypothetical protein
MNSRLKSLLALALSALSAASWSGTITCLPNNQRVATLSGATECRTQNSINLNTSADVNSILGTAHDWTKEGELTAAGTNKLLTVDADSWGTDVTGSWEIDDSFWETYSRAVITMHVGQGGGNPDAFAWVIEQGQTSGLFSYQRIAGTGGGLSNLHLFGSGPAYVIQRVVPEPGTGLLMAGAALAAWASRRRSR